MAASPAVLNRNQVGGSRSTITARRRSFFADLAGISPTMALFGAFIIVPTAFALFLSFTNWNVDGPIHWAGWLTGASSSPTPSHVTRCW